MKAEHINQLEECANQTGQVFGSEVVDTVLEEFENVSFETWIKTKFILHLAAYREHPNVKTNENLVEALTDLVELVSFYRVKSSNVLPENLIKKISAFLQLAKGDLLLENLQFIIEANSNRPNLALLEDTESDGLDSDIEDTESDGLDSDMEDTELDELDSDAEDTELDDLHADAALHISVTEISHHEAISTYPDLRAYQKQLIRLEEEILNKIHPTYQMSLEEAIFHIERKNAGRELYGSSFHGELIHNPESHSFVLFDPEIIKALINKFTLMSQGKQDRTQFIIYPYGLADGHTILLDANYNIRTRAFEFVVVDSSRDSTQYRFLKLLIEALQKTEFKYQFIGCQTGLQHDSYSCTNFNIALGSTISRLPFVKFKKAKKVPQPEFMDTREIEIKELMADTDTPPLAKIEWVSVTTFGLKAIKMAQSLQYMKVLLLEYSNNDSDLSNKVTEAWSKQYNMDSFYQKYYMNHRYQIMSYKYKGEPYQYMDVNAVVERTRTNTNEDLTPAIALRRLSAGYGPMNALAFLLKNVNPDVVNEQGGTDKRTGLHWALRKGKNHRAYMLLNAGAQTNIPDQAGVTAGSIIMENPKFQALRKYIG